MGWGRGLVVKRGRGPLESLGRLFCFGFFSFKNELFGMIFERLRVLFIYPAAHLL